MMSDAYAARELARFRALANGRNVTAAQITEWTRVARSAARSDTHLQRAVTAWLDTHSAPPTPLELRATIDATTVTAHPSAARDCPTCQGSGRRSYWALITVERWEDSGRIRRRTCEEIPCTGDSNYWLMHEPELAARVDGINQRVALLSGFCDCPRGVTLRQGQSALMRSSQ